MPHKGQSRTLDKAEQCAFLPTSRCEGALFVAKGSPDTEKVTNVIDIIHGKDAEKTKLHD